MPEDNSDYAYEKESSFYDNKVENMDSGKKTLPFVLSLIPFLIFGYIAFKQFSAGNAGSAFKFGALGLLLSIIVKMSVVLVNQWEESVVLRLGKYNRILKPGLKFIIPIVEAIAFRDMRLRTMNLQHQETLTKDNISVSIDAIVFMKIVDSKKSITEIQDFIESTGQIAKTSLRNVIGQKELDTLLSKRHEIADEIRKIVDKTTEKWGIVIEAVELRDIALPEDMKRIMAKQAEAERERRAVIIKSEGEFTAASNLLKASQTLSKSPIAFELRKLETISRVSEDKNTIIFAVPLEVMGSVMKASSGLIGKKK